jgi:hypothetical protein
LEVTTDGRHITFLLVSLYEAGYGVQVMGSPAVFRELICLRKSAPIPFVIGGGERECGISISDQPSTLDAGRSSLFVLDYDYFSGLTTKSAKKREIGKIIDSKIIETTEDMEVAAGLRLTSQANAEFSNPSTSELAQASENTSPTRSANGPAEEALRAEMQRSGNIEPRMTRIYTDGQQGDAPGTCSGHAFSNPFTSELARAFGNTSPTRTANGPAGAHFAPRDRISQIGDRVTGSDGGNQLADSMEFLEGQSQAGLQMDNQKGPTIRTANDPTASREYSSSVLIRDIRGKNSSSPATALRAPYFMHPSIYHRGLHKRRSPSTVLDSRLSTLDSAAEQRRRFRIGFFGTHDREFYTKHYHFPGMNRFEILEVFLQKYGNRMTHLRGFPRDWDPCEIAVSIDARGGDRRGKTFLSQDHYFEALQECDFVLSPPGWCMPVSHNLIESMFCGAIPITNGGAFMAEPLADDVNCLAFEDEEGLVAVIECALAMNAGEVARVREAVRDYYERFLDSKAFGERFIRTNSTRIFVNAEENSVPLVFPGMVFPWAVPADTMQT